MNAPMGLFEYQYEMVFGEADRRLADRRKADRRKADREATALYAQCFADRRQAERRA